MANQHRAERARVWIGVALVVSASGATGQTVTSPKPLAFDPQVDAAADPCADFYQYACGPWLRTHPIPADRSAWDPYYELAEKNGVLRLETEMARVRPTREQRRDPASQHHPMTVAELHALAPGVAVAVVPRGDRRARGAGLQCPVAPVPRRRDRPVAQVAARRTASLPALAATARPGRLPACPVARGGLPLLRHGPPRGAADAAVVEGVCSAHQRPPWRGGGQGVRGGPVPPEAKRRALEDVRSIQAALRDDIAGIPWMGESTREEALRKLDAFRVKVGYPDRKFDHLGNLRDWWTPVDAARFEERAQCLVDEYSGFLVVDDKRLNGRLTLGENLADNGGIRLAYAALERRLGSGARPRVDGFDPEQRFFLSFAKTQCGAVSDETARNRLLTDPHSPGRWRVNGTLRNMPEFRAAFACKAGDSMVSPNPCRVW